ncbi:MAG: hypothetical protein KZQ60_04460 [Candidatus Thiodiazotropha sp. (ex Lucinoma aequizonata)]|nr:hypothetical protein [Candidatus Thiodiazotropha sp. (ex Lucinoma aequizonata)]MCU7911255.1 hypothetical protein [Candidatus Thiodiazotropha sp. (ex Lucinoma aequizonata)]
MRSFSMPFIFPFRSPFRPYNRTYAYRGLTAFAPLSMAVSDGNSIKNPLASQKHAHNVADGTIISRYENS